MKKSLFSFCAASVLSVVGFTAPSVNASLLITTVTDGTQVGGNPKALEIVATEAIADLSVFGIVRNTNGGTDGFGTPVSLPPVSLAAGEFFVIAASADAEASLTALGITVNIVNSILNVNGDDILGLVNGSTVIDVFGAETQADTNFYEDSIATRNTSSITGDPDGSVDAADNFFIVGYSDELAISSFGTFVIPEPASLALVGLGGLAMLGRVRRHG